MDVAAAAAAAIARQGTDIVTSLPGSVFMSSAGAAAEAETGSAASYAAMDATTPTPTGDAIGVSSPRRSFLARLQTMLAYILCARGIRLNGRRLATLRQIGEGGFSYVYLVEDMATGEHFALKRILIQSSDQVSHVALPTGPARGVAPFSPPYAMWRRILHPLRPRRTRPSGRSTSTPRSRTST